jgi:hypothetical protein
LAEAFALSQGGYRSPALLLALLHRPCLVLCEVDMRTPQWVLDKLYGIFGEFDLDAAAANPPNVSIPRQPLQP